MMAVRVDSLPPAGGVPHDAGVTTGQPGTRECTRDDGCDTVAATQPALRVVPHACVEAT
jgi:hypothetical protein